MYKIREARQGSTDVDFAIQSKSPKVQAADCCTAELQNSLPLAVVDAEILYGFRETLCEFMVVKTFEAIYSH